MVDLIASHAVLRPWRLRNSLDGKLMSGQTNALVAFALAFITWFGVFRMQPTSLLHLEIILVGIDIALPTDKNASSLWGGSSLDLSG